MSIQASQANPAWYCVRTLPKHERIAGDSLRELPGGIEVFSPRLRVRKPTRRGPVWFTEALFPCYLFARFPLHPLLSQVRYARGVADVVHFGDRWVAVADEAITELRVHLGGQEVYEVPGELRPGEEVRIAVGPMAGLTAVVQRYLPGPQRVHLLLEFLGQVTPVHLSATQVLPTRRHLLK